MNFFEALLLGIVEGLTEFLPVSSSAHLTIVEGLLGLAIDDDAVTAFTAVIQMGAILAVLLFFRADIWRIASAWARGLAAPEARATLDYRMGWYVIVGTVPVVVVGLLGRDLVTGPLRNLWWVAGALIGWSVVMVLAERVATQHRHEEDLRMRDAVIMGLLQCMALIPGVSRSGATISAGLFTGLDRVTATRMSFFLSVPALTAAGFFQLPAALSGSIPIASTIVATAVSFVVAYGAVAWLLRFVANRPITWFVGYRAALGVVLLVALASGRLSAT